jgi:hypothetical protein
MSVFQLGKFEFKTKAEAIAKERNIRIKHDPRNQTDVFPLRGQNREFVEALLNRHPKLEEKLIHGIKGIGVRRSKANGKHTEYVVIGTDGTHTSFSKDTCFKGGISTAEFDFKSALRREIQPQIETFRKLNNGNSDEHVDHYPISFDSLVDQFVEASGITSFNKGMTQRDPIIVQYWILTDRDCAGDWMSFHQAIVDEGGVRMLSAQQNMSDGNRQKETK